MLFSVMKLNDVSELFVEFFYNARADHILINKLGFCLTNDKTK